ncbi:MAG: hypothetical protein ACRD0W_24915 [Acidimicrobiales bacterium]
MTEFVSIAWPGLLALAGFLALIVHAARNERRRHPRGHYRVELAVRQARDTAALARAITGTHTRETP